MDRVKKISFCDSVEVNNIVSRKMSDINSRMSTNSFRRMSIINAGSTNNPMKDMNLMGRRVSQAPSALHPSLQHRRGTVTQPNLARRLSRMPSVSWQPAEELQEKDVIYHALIRELKGVKHRVEKVLGDFDVANEIEEYEAGDSMEESQETVERLMERYHELHSYKQEEVIVDELALEDFLNEDCVENGSSISNREFMKAYDLTSDDLTKLKSINIDMKDLASELKRLAEEKAIEAKELTSKSTYTQPDSRYNKMFNLFTKESLKNVKMASELTDTQKHFEALKAKNESLQRQSEVDKERAEASTKKLLQAEKKLFSLNREVQYLKVMSKKHNQNEAIATPTVFSSKERPLSSSSTVTTKSITLLNEVREKGLLKEEEFKEITKLSAEEQILRLEKLLEMTQFIEKDPQKQKTKQPTAKEKTMKEARKSVVKKPRISLTKKGTSNTTTSPSTSDKNKSKKSTKSKPLPFQKVTVTKTVSAPARPTLSCNVTVPIIFASQDSSLPGKDSKTEKKSYRPKTSGWKKKKLVGPEEQMRANNLYQNTEIGMSTPQSQIQRTNPRQYINSASLNRSKNERPTLAKVFSIDFKSDLLEEVSKNVPNTKEAHSYPMVKLEDNSSFYSKGRQEKSTIHSAMGDIKIEQFLNGLAVPVQQNKSLKSAVEEFNSRHSKTLRECVTSLNETREQLTHTSHNNIGVMVIFGKGQEEKNSVAKISQQQQKKNQVTKFNLLSQENATPKSRGSFGRESETAAKYRLFRSWLSHNKAGAPPREVLPDVVGSSLNSVSSKSPVEKRPLGQLRASNANSHRPSYRAPILSYSIRNLGSHRKTDDDDEFSRIPAERLYSALVGSSLHKTIPGNSPH